MAVQSIAILGLGLIGGSLAKAVKSTCNNITVSAFDKKDVLWNALNDQSIDHSLESFDEALSSDLIFICLPVDSALFVFEKLAPRLKAGQILTDVCGVKSVFQNKWNEIGKAGEYFGGHPMTGKEKGGYKNSDPLLFENSVYIINDSVKDSDNSKYFIELIQTIGARILFLDPVDHDKVVANVSHLPQLLSVALINSVTHKDNGINFLDFSGGGFRDMTRIASSEFEMWKPVIQNNKEEILSVLKSFEKELSAIKNNLLADNYNQISKMFEDARIRRDEVPHTQKGFLNPLHDIFVFVKDEPGVISRISTALFERDINIKDIELLKFREGTGGTFRLSFDTIEQAKEASVIIKYAGFEIKK